MDKNYHDKIIDLFCNNISYFEKQFDFSIKNTFTKVYFHPYTEIDIIVEGMADEQALIEVKSNGGLINKFTGDQFKNYRKYDSNASVYLLLGTKDKSLEISDLKIIQFHPLN